MAWHSDLNLHTSVIFARVPKASIAYRLKAQVMAVPCLRRLVAGLSPRRPWFDLRSVHMRFVVDKVALGQFFPPEYVGFPLDYKEKRKN